MCRRENINEMFNKHTAYEKLMKVVQSVMNRLGIYEQLEHTLNDLPDLRRDGGANYSSNKDAIRKIDSDGRCVSRKVR